MGDPVKIYLRGLSPFAGICERDAILGHYGCATEAPKPTDHEDTFYRIWGPAEFTTSFGEARAEFEEAKARKIAQLERDIEILRGIEAPTQAEGER